MIIRFNEEIFKEIVFNVDGEYINGSNIKEVVEMVIVILNGMDKKEFESK